MIAPTDTGKKHSGTIKAWMAAVRPRTLPAAVAPVLVGTALAVARERFSILPALAALCGALLLQVAVNLANDYFDFRKGVDLPDRLGPPRVTQGGIIPAGQVKAGMITTLFLAVVVGGYLVAVGGWPIVLIGLASILAALLYSGGPYPLGSRGLGDLFVFIFFGPVAVCGTYYVQALNLHGPVLTAAVPVGLLITAILVVNNLRDIDTDRRAGKITLAVILGESMTRLEYLLLLSVSYAFPVILWAGGLFTVWIIIPLLSLPLTLPLLGIIARRPGPVFNKALEGTAKLTLLYSILFSAGLVLGRGPV